LFFCQLNISLKKISSILKAFHHKKVIALYDFLENGVSRNILKAQLNLKNIKITFSLLIFDSTKDPNEDLYFKKGDVLTILEYTQGENWWKAVNSKGAEGLIPVPLIRRLKPVISSCFLSLVFTLELYFNNYYILVKKNEWPLKLTSIQQQQSPAIETTPISNDTTNLAESETELVQVQDNEEVGIKKSFYQEIKL
jgi:hypothetical protein